MFKIGFEYLVLKNVRSDFKKDMIVKCVNSYYSRYDGCEIYVFSIKDAGGKTIELGIGDGDASDKKLFASFEERPFKSKFSKYLRDQN